jgi:hypothetical protein
MGWPVSRRALLRGTAGVVTAAVAAPVVGRCDLLPAASAMDDSPFRPTYYVSNQGSDEADGLSTETAWATIEHANGALPDDGSILLFRRSDTFYGELALPFGCEVGAYGSGDKPVLTMFKLLNRSAGWVEDSAGIWKIDLASPDTHDGYTGTTDTNIGYLVVDGFVNPARKSALSELTAPWDFWCNMEQNLLYVAAAANPTTSATNIQAAPNGNAYGPTGRIIWCAKGSNDIHDVHVTGSGGCGIGGTGPDVHVHECLIDYIGGSILRDGRNRRYGNAIENWVGVKRWLIENNEIAQAYDAAFSPQGHAGDTGSWEDLTVRGNYIHDCSQTFEFWSSGTDSAGGYKRIRIEGNWCERGGYSVFSDVRPDQDVRVHLNTYTLGTSADILVQDNVFDDAYSAYSYYADEAVGYVSRNNVIRLRAGKKMQFQRPETVEQASSWQAATGREEGSRITVVR